MLKSIPKGIEKKIGKKFRLEEKMRKAYIEYLFLEQSRPVPVPPISLVEAV